MQSGRDDVFSALAIFVCAVIVMIFVIPAETIPGEEEELAQAFMPTLAMACMALGALFLLARSAMTRFGARPAKSAAQGADIDTDDGDEAGADGLFWRTCGVAVAAMIASVIGLWQLGFMLGGGLMIAGIGLIFNRRAWLSTLVLSATLPVVAYFLALHGLGLALP